MTDPFSKISFGAAPPVILCIGSDRVLGDALGPITGELLKRKFDVPAFVYGSLTMPVTALNLRRAATFVRARHKGSRVIAVDGAVGPEIGKITVTASSLRPGLASGKILPSVGDVSVIVTVATEAALLPSVRLGFVYELALRTAELVSESVKAHLGSSADATSVVRYHNTQID